MSCWHNYENCQCTKCGTVANGVRDAVAWNAAMSLAVPLIAELVAVIEEADYRAECGDEYKRRNAALDAAKEILP